MLRYLLALTALSLLLAACGPAEVPPEEAGTMQAATPVAVDEGQAAAPVDAAQVDAGPPPDFAGADYETTASGLQIAILDEGAGERAEPGDIVRVHYRGLLGDGTVFDSSEGRDPFRFALGQGAVIRGWDEGIGLLNEGGHALLVIPADLGYGATGSGGVIPPNATLYFEVELVEVLEGGPSDPVEVAEGDYETTASGLQHYVIEEGQGQIPEEGEPVRIDFTAWFEDGTRLDSSIDAGQPLVFALGSEQIFPGLSEAVSLMRVGGRSQFIIPPDLAFGEQGAAGIPPDTALVFLIDLLEVLPAAPKPPSTSTTPTTRPPTKATSLSTLKKEPANLSGLAPLSNFTSPAGSPTMEPRSSAPTIRANPSSCRSPAVRHCPAGMPVWTGCASAASARSSCPLSLVLARKGLARWSRPTLPSSGSSSSSRSSPARSNGSISSPALALGAPATFPFIWPFPLARAGYNLAMNRLTAHSYLPGSAATSGPAPSRFNRRAAAHGERA
jgi:peptidylprolyl isomerase